MDSQITYIALVLLGLRVGAELGKIILSWLRHRRLTVTLDRLVDPLVTLASERDSNNYGYRTPVSDNSVDSWDCGPPPSTQTTSISADNKDVVLILDELPEEPGYARVVRSGGDEKKAKQ